MHGLDGLTPPPNPQSAPSDVLASIGGVAVLFPLFFLLLVAPPPGRESNQQDKGPLLPLLLSILARALRAHETNQKEFYRVNGVAMLEHAIRRIPTRHLPAAAETQRCVGMLMDLCAAAQGHPQLEAAVVRRLLSPALWAHAPLGFQIELQRQVVSEWGRETNGAVRGGTKGGRAACCVRVLICMYECTR